MKNKIIVCLGDSITCNWDQKSYPDYWQQLINQAKLPYKIINAGVSGETAQDGYYRLDRDVVTHEPHLVTIMFGHNDVHAPHISPLMFVQYIRRSVNQLQHNTQADIWLLTPQQIGEPKIEKDYQPYLELLHQAAKDKQIKLINLWRVFKRQNTSDLYQEKAFWPGYSGFDYLHPNSKGHQLIAQKLMVELKKITTTTSNTSSSNPQTS